MSRIRLSNLLAFLAFIVCASIHGGAEARTPGQPDACREGNDELGRQALELRDYWENHEVPPASEVQALGPDDGPEEAGLDAPAVVTLTLRVLPILPFAREVARVATVACTTQPFVSSALPRGPPSVRC
jgi:hypothetical protein